MKVKYSALVSDMRGKLNGSVASKNRFGSYLRNKKTPVNLRSPSQTGVRQKFTVNAQAWRGLTASQRQQWNAAVVNFKKKNIFGDVHELSGFGLYCRLNGHIANIAGTIISVPPLPTSVEGISSLTLTAAHGTPALQATFSPAIDAATTVQVFATAPQSAGKDFIKSEYRLIGLLTTADSSPAALLTKYVAKFGAIGAAGTKIFVKFVPINTATGIPGTGITASAIVAV